MSFLMYFDCGLYFNLSCCSYWIRLNDSIGIEYKTTAASEQNPLLIKNKWKINVVVFRNNRKLTIIGLKNVTNSNNLIQTM